MGFSAPTTLNECWSVDFLSDADITGRQIRILAANDDASRESLILTVTRSMTGAKVAAQLRRWSRADGLTPGLAEVCRTASAVSSVEQSLEARQRKLVSPTTEAT